jgi:Protein of unknown function (DUF3276)
VENKNEDDRSDLYSNRVRAGKRTYFFDVKTTRNEVFYITITESKKKLNDNGTQSFEKHKIFLYQEDFKKFAAALNLAIEKVEEVSPSDNFEDSGTYTIEERYYNMGLEKPNPESETL